MCTLAPPRPSQLDVRCVMCLRSIRPWIADIVAVLNSGQAGIRSDASPQVPADPIARDGPKKKSPRFGEGFFFSCCGESYGVTVAVRLAPE